MLWRYYKNTLSEAFPMENHAVEPQFHPEMLKMLSYLVGRHSAESPASASVSRASRKEDEEVEEEGAW